MHETSVARKHALLGDPTSYVPMNEVYFRIFRSVVNCRGISAKDAATAVHMCCTIPSIYLCLKLHPRKMRLTFHGSQNTRATVIAHPFLFPKHIYDKSAKNGCCNTFFYSGQNVTLQRSGTKYFLACPVAGNLSISGCYFVSVTNSAQPPMTFITGGRKAQM